MADRLDVPFVLILTPKCRSGSKLITALFRGKEGVGRSIHEWARQPRADWFDWIQAQDASFVALHVHCDQGLHVSMLEPGIPRIMMRRDPIRTARPRRG